MPGTPAKLASPRRQEDIPYDSMLERFRVVRDEIELKIRDWLERPELELKKLKEEHERERRERLAASRWETDDHAQRLVRLPHEDHERRHLPATASATLVRS